jgi:Holliday junction resolvase
MDRYGKGARRERLIKRTLEGLGYRVMRSAGSKGKADLIALAKYG